MTKHCYLHIYTSKDKELLVVTKSRWYSKAQNLIELLTMVVK